VHKPRKKKEKTRDLKKSIGSLGWPQNHALLKKSLKLAAGQYELRMTVEVCVIKV